jgi:hypothetical protein
MALGYFDAMGVWVYGEDDVFTSASAWVNKLGSSVSDAVKRQYDVNTAPTDNAVAALFNTPGSATRAAAGVTATAAALMSLDGRLDVLEPLSVGDVARTPFTPVWTNMTLGTGSAVLFAEYSVTKGRCHGTVLLRLGTGRPTTTTYMQWPVAPATVLLDSFLPIGEAIFVDISASVRQPGVIYMGNQSNGMRIALVNTAGTYEAFTDLNATVPFTWAANDTIALDFDYPVA